MAFLKFREKQDYEKIKLFKCDIKAHSANQRYKDTYLSKEDVYDMLNRFDFKCFYCGDEIKPKDWQLDHFYPKSKGGKNTLENITCTCRWCNKLKNDMDGFAFIEKCKNIHQSNFLSKNNLDVYNHETDKKYKKLGKKLKEPIKVVESLNN